jgi:hypothetical protein
VEQAVGAERARQKAETLEPYKLTERRLYALPHLEEKIKVDKENLEFYTQAGEGGVCGQGVSKSIVRFQRGGYRVSPEEIQDALVTDLKARIAADEEEVRVVRGALGAIAEDIYYPAVEGRYLKNEVDEVIAEKIGCDTSTVRKHRGRLVRIVAIRLYGAAAVQ